MPDMAGANIFKQETFQNQYVWRNSHRQPNTSKYRKMASVTSERQVKIDVCGELSYRGYTRSDNNALCSGLDLRSCIFDQAWRPPDAVLVSIYGKPCKSWASCYKKFEAQRRGHYGQATSLPTAILLPVTEDHVHDSGRSQCMAWPRTTADH